MNRGFTLVEMMIALGIASIASLGAIFFFGFADTESRALSAQAEALNSSQQLAATFQKWFLTKPAGGFATCSNVAAGKNAYCLDACSSTESDCKIGGVSSSVGANPRVAYFSTSCEAATGKLAKLAFPAFCGVACDLGKRPVTTYQVVSLGKSSTKKYPTAGEVDAHAGSALCFTRVAGGGTLQLAIATYSNSNDTSITLNEQTYVFPEATFDVPGVYFVNEP